MSPFPDGVEDAPQIADAPDLDLRFQPTQPTQPRTVLVGDDTWATLIGPDLERWIVELEPAAPRGARLALKVTVADGPYAGNYLIPLIAADE